MNTETGINLDRGCTDIICAIFFLLFLGTMFGVAIFGTIKGEPKAFIKPYDFSKSICGVNKTVEGHGKLYFTKLSPNMWDAMEHDTLVRKIVFENAVCVSECPKEAGKDLNELCPKTHAYEAKCSGIKTVKTTSVMDICFPHYSTLSKED